MGFHYVSKKHDWRYLKIIQDLIIPLVAIATAELGDKTQISILIFSSKTDKHLQILFAVTLAFIIVDGIAIAAGCWISTLLPMGYLKIVTGIVFIIFGVFMFLNREEENKKTKRFNSPFITAFLLVLLTEWGDKTQIAAALFATKYNPYLVFVGSILALFMLSVIPIFFGKILSEKLPRKKINMIAAVVFIIIGITFFIF
ncbi:MAG: TMEM165/GDT1 family protein [Candidatus Thermoplasmatota archaeon]